MTTESVAVGDRVRIAYDPNQGAHYTGKEGVVERATPSILCPGKTLYRVRLEDGSIAPVYAVEPLTQPAEEPAEDFELVVDLARVHAALYAKEILGADAFASDVVELARFILGEREGILALQDAVNRHFKENPSDLDALVHAADITVAVAGDAPRAFHPQDEQPGIHDGPAVDVSEPLEIEDGSGDVVTFEDRAPGAYVTVNDSTPVIVEPDDLDRVIAYLTALKG